MPYIYFAGVYLGVQSNILETFLTWSLTTCVYILFDVTVYHKLPVHEVCRFLHIGFNALMCSSFSKFRGSLNQNLQISAVLKKRWVLTIYFRIYLCQCTAIKLQLNWFLYFQSQIVSSYTITFSDHLTHKNRPQTISIVKLCNKNSIKGCEFFSFSIIYHLTFRNSLVTTLSKNNQSKLYDSFERKGLFK